MASELKPCPFCGGAAKLLTYRICEDAMGASVKCTSCQVSTTEFEDAYAPTADAIAAWNTRPAPAATDTGLETVEVQRLTRSCHDWLTIPPSKAAEYRSKGNIVRELCDRSQDEELLAAKDAELRDALVDVRKYILRSEAAQKELHSEKEARVGWMKIATQEQKRANKAEADNAAQAARIKELEAELLSVRNWIDTEPVPAVKALEAKLAAAEKALEPFADISDLIAAETEGMAETDELVLHFHDYEFAKWPVSLFRKARAVLGGKPSC